MIPVSRYMDTYPQPHPHHGNHSPYPRHYPPSWETMPQVKLDPSKPPVAYEPWSHGCGYCYPNQMECHGCCNNMYPPGCYSFRPPHTHPPSFPPVYYPGPHPSFAGMYPAYHVPPAHYMTEQPRYEYDKNLHGECCCGCPNHRWDQKEGNKGVRIEEHNAKTDAQESPSSGPVGVKNNHPFYPFVWIPPEDTKDKDSSKPSELEKKQGNWLPLDMKGGAEMAKYVDPKSWNRWFPNVKSLKEGRDEKKNDDQKSEDTKAHYPFPMIWVPAYDKLEDAEQKDRREHNKKTGEVLDLPQKWRIVPVNPLNNDQGDRPRNVEDVSRNGVGSKKEEVVKPKNVLLEPTIENVVKELPKEMEKTVKSIPVKQAQENTKKLSDKSEKRRSPSPPKGSKLPPVCLRVDPFPRKKNGNGSRSPSLGKKAEQPQEDNTDPSSQAVKAKTHEDSNVNEPVHSKAQEVLPRKEIKVLDANAKQDRQEKSQTNCDRSQMQINVALGKNEEDSRRETAETEDKCGNSNNSMENKESVEATAMKPEENKKEKRQLSSTEAATLIQSAYRGFEVRKWEPLKKLRQIGKVREQVTDVRKRINALETSVELQKDEKQRVIIAETIMALLLQLDTIQGLHPSVRHTRKSVARELVSLQEKLDSLPIPKEEKVTASAETGAEDTSGVAYGNELTEEMKNAEQTETFCEGIVGGSSDSAESTHEDAKELCGGTSDGTVDEKSYVDDAVHMNLAESIVSPGGAIAEVGEVNSGACGQSAIASASLEDGMKYEDLGSDDMAAEPQNAIAFEVPVEAQQHVNETSQASEELELNEVSESTKGCNEMQEESQKVLASEELEEAQQNVKIFPQACKESTVNKVPKSAEVAQGMDMKADSEVEEVEVISKEDVSDMGVGDASTHNEAVGSFDEDKPIQFDASILAELPVEVLDEGSPACDTRENPVLEVEKDVGSLPVLSSAEEKTVKEAVNVHLDTLTSESGGGKLVIQEDMAQATEDNNGVEHSSTLDESKTLDGLEVKDIGDNVSESETMQSIPVEKEPDCKEVDTAIGKVEVENEAIENMASDIEGQVVKNAGDDRSDLIPIEKEPEHEGLLADAAEGVEKMEIVNSAPVLEKTVAIASAEDDTSNPIREPEFGETKHNVLIEENEKLREMVEKLVQAGKQQIEVISNLNGRVKDLEKKLVKKNKHRMRRPRAGGMKFASSKSPNSPTKEKLVASAV